MIQIGAAVMYDKPIGILADNGVSLPVTLIRAATAVCVFNPNKKGDLERASKALKKSMAKVNSEITEKAFLYDYML